MKIAIPFFYALCFCSLLVLSGCNLNGNNTEDYEDAALEENTPEDTAEETGEGEGDNKKDKADTYSLRFQEFDLDVMYENEQSYKAEYEGLETGEEAEIEDTINDQKLEGDEAVKEIRSKLENLTFLEDTPDEKAINEVESAFSLKEGYKNFNLKVTFENGKEKEYSVKQ
ncbi:YusW family protein [Metabacillus arenae]|uniref:YusW-like protein n=1 Tax=Metabacillus arenae TaxID=2771434 RepID=A0A926S063_9BACI|nr:YusW family protein [Metabacillus arenae]MBD1379714.1 hypothetical protein [Metabacillus arenae]